MWLSRQQFSVQLLHGVQLLHTHGIFFLNWNLLLFYSFYFFFLLFAFCRYRSKTCLHFFALLCLICQCVLLMSSKSKGKDSSGAFSFAPFWKTTPAIFKLNIKTKKQKEKKNNKTNETKAQYVYVYVYFVFGIFVVVFFLSAVASSTFLFGKLRCLLPPFEFELALMCVNLSVCVCVYVCHVCCPLFDCLDDDVSQNVSGTFAFASNS